VALGQALAQQLAGEWAQLAADLAQHPAHVEAEISTGRAALDRRRAALDAFNEAAFDLGVRLSCMRAALTSFPDTM